MSLPVPIPQLIVTAVAVRLFLLQLDCGLLREDASYGLQNQQTPKTKHHYEKGLLSKDVAYGVENQ